MSKKSTKNSPAVLSIDDLNKNLSQKQADLLAAKRGLAAGELTNPRVITVTRREIARILTAKRLQESSNMETKS